MDILALVFVIVALVVGLGLGWFLGSRPTAEWRARHAARDTEAKEIDEKFRRAIGELATMSERAEQVPSLNTQLGDARAEVSRLGAEIAGLKSEAAERLNTATALREEMEAMRTRLTAAEEARGAALTELAGLKSTAHERDAALQRRFDDQKAHHEREMKRLAEAEEKLQAKFNEIGEKLLTGAQKRFFETAHTSLEGLSKESLAQLDKKVGPIGETLERYRKRVEELEQTRVKDFNQLHGIIDSVRAGQDRVIEGANRISTTLRGATKARGNWGELQLENLLESCGLYDKADFKREVAVEGGALRPDAVINIPGGRKLVVDVKNVFNTYAAANEAGSEEERRELLRSHARELRTHIDQLSAKRYQDHVEGSADFVVMFVPGEHVLYAAMTMDSGLLDYALQRRIVLSSPLNFMSIALTVATIWRQAGAQADAAEIAKLGKELYDRLAVVAGHISSLRRALSSTNQHFDAMVGSFDTNLRRTGERFESLAVDTSAKQLTESPPLSHTPRALVNFPDEGETAAN